MASCPIIQIIRLNVENRYKQLCLSNMTTGAKLLSRKDADTKPKLAWRIFLMTSNKSVKNNQRGHIQLLNS